MRIAIADDLETDREKISSMLPSSFGKLGYSITCLDVYCDGSELLRNFSKGKYDIIFLDIYMSEINGIEAARLIRKMDHDVKLIFISTSNDFAAESYSVCADYYLLKPYSENNLDTVLSFINLDDYKNKRTITLKQSEPIHINSIIYSMFHGHYETIYLQNNSPVKIRMTHSELLDIFRTFPDFIPCSKGVIVNLNMVESLENDSFIMKNGDLVPISRRRYSDVKKLYSDFLILKVRGGR